MKKVIYSLLVALFGVALISCASRSETTSNLESIITSETNQGIKYAGYAEQADKDGLKAIAAMFRTAAEAQVINAAKLNEVLASMGVKNFEPVIVNPQVGTTEENYKNAIEAQTYEVNTALPEFANVARIEKQPAAADAFEHSIKVQKHLGDIFVLTAEALAKGDVIDMFYVCPTCGASFAAPAPIVCDVCDTPSTSFKAMPTK